MCPVHQESQPCPPPWSWQGWSCVFGLVLECSPEMSVPKQHRYKDICINSGKFSSQQYTMPNFLFIYALYVFFCIVQICILSVEWISSLWLTFTSAAAALKLIFATDSLLRLRGSRLRPERELVKEQSEAAPGVMGVWGTLYPSTSSTIRKARPRANGSTIWRTMGSTSCSYKEPNNMNYQEILLYRHTCCK